MENNRFKLLQDYIWSSGNFDKVVQRTVVYAGKIFFSRMTLIRIMVFFQLSPKTVKMTGYSLI